MIEAVMFWNEPNNKSHWDFQVDPDWNIFAEMVGGAARAVRQVNPELTRVLGGMSPIDRSFIENLQGKGALEHMSAIAVHGFPLDWNHWKLDEWPEMLRMIRAATDLPVWVSEVGISTFGAEEVQVFGLRRTGELLRGLAPRVHWYSLYDLPKAWPATTRHREAEGSSYYRHFYMGILREDGSPKPALEVFREFAPDLGICQWFHFNDHRLDEAVGWLRELGVKHLRTGLSWADSFRPGAEEWFTRQMEALAEFEVTVTLCFTPEHRGILPHHTSAPLRPEEYAEFCVEMVERFAPRGGRMTPEALERQRIELPWNGGRSYADQRGLTALRYLLRPDLAEAPMKVVVVSEHPGDETLAAGSRIAALAAVGAHVTLIHTAESNGAAAGGAKDTTLENHLRSALATARADVILCASPAGSNLTATVQNALAAVTAQAVPEEEWAPVILEAIYGDEDENPDREPRWPATRVRLTADQQAAKRAALEQLGHQLSPADEALLAEEKIRPTNASRQMRYCPETTEVVPASEN